MWTLATPESYRAVGDRFNVSKSSVYNCIQTVIKVILNELCDKFIKWPNALEKPAVSQRFSCYGVRNILGAIDGCHIPIKKPVENGVEYFNRKKFYLMVLQAVCKHDLMFIDCDIRWPGSVHDGRVLRTSDMYPRASELCGPLYFLVGDSAYPIKSWLMSPYRNNGHLLPLQVHYNRILSKTRVCIENAFALLKGRFRRLKDKLDRSVQEIPSTVMAACVLHNICLIHDEGEIEQYIIEGRDERNIVLEVAVHNNDDEIAGAQRRDMLAEMLWNDHDV